MRNYEYQYAITTPMTLKEKKKYIQYKEPTPGHSRLFMRTFMLLRHQPILTHTYTHTRGKKKDIRG